METPRAQEAPSPSSSLPENLVFLSFGSNDTDRTFASHLHSALSDTGLRAFEVGGGETRTNLDPVYIKAIKESRVFVIVISGGYCLSRWCLDQLWEIVNRSRSFQSVILPVFYGANPSQVRELARDLKGLFAGSEDENWEETEEDRTGRVKQWKTALDFVLEIKGFVLEDQADRYESKFIRKIVQEVERIADRRIHYVTRYPVGLDKRVKSINQWLQNGSADVGIMVVYGMGGIGKSTIVKAVYNENFHRFDGSSFLSKIREAVERPNGLARLQRQLISNINNRKVKKIYNVDEGSLMIKDAVSCKRILLFLDDVEESEQLDAVLGMREWFYPGSKIVITTRNEHLLKPHDGCEIYRVKELDRRESLRLFSWHAFGQGNPPENFDKFSRIVVYHCGGIPLALKVLGSFLSDKSLDMWEDTMKKLRAIAEGDIVSKLRVTYDSLEDDHDQSLFLDIACFFVGKEKDYVVTVLDACGYFTVAGIQSLVGRCLVDVDQDNKLLVHQLLQDMGREIICQESSQLGRRSRVWSHIDSYNLLTEHLGTESIEGLILDMQVLKQVKPLKNLDRVNGKHIRSEEALHEFLRADQSYSSKRLRVDFFGNAVSSSLKIPENAEFETRAFAKMRRLRLLKLSHVNLVGDYKEFPNRVTWIHWLGFPLKSIPHDLPLDRLVALDLRYSKITTAWKGIKFLVSLKILNLSHCRDLRESPNFSGVPNVERLLLKDCTRLVELHESIRGLEKLVLLNLTGCRNLRRLPKKIHMLESLQKLFLSGCSKLESLPMELGSLKSLVVLHADQIALSPSESTRNNVKSWRSFFFSQLTRATKCSKSVRFSLASLSGSLRSLSLADCNLSDDVFPTNLSSLPFLNYLNLSGNLIRNLPSSVIELRLLRDLWLDSCKLVQSLPEFPASLIDLKAVNCTALERITNLPNLMESLFLDVSGCDKLVEVEGLFKLEPIWHFDDGMIGNLGSSNIALIWNAELELFNKMTGTTQRLPVQGLYEFGIFSTYFPGSEVPPSYINKAMGQSTSLVISLDSSIGIKGLSICIVYGRCKEQKFRFWIKQGWCSFYIRVTNCTRGTRWVYSPTFIGVPGEDQEVMFSSYWERGNWAEGNGDLTVSVIDWSPAFRLKEVGARLIYDLDKPERAGADDKTRASYQLRENAYFLSHPEYFMLRESTEDALRAVLYENLFEREKAAEAADGGVAEEDDSTDYADFHESGDDEIGDEDDDYMLNSLW